MFICIDGFSIDKCDDNGFTMENDYLIVEKGSEWFNPDDKEYRFIGGEVRLEQEDGTWIEISKETLNQHFKEVKDRVIVDVEFNNEPPTKYDYKHFNVFLEGGEVKLFHYHKNNPIPIKEEMIGLSWRELRVLCLKKFYEAIKG